LFLQDLVNLEVPEVLWTLYHLSVLGCLECLELLSLHQLRQVLELHPRRLFPLVLLSLGCPVNLAVQLHPYHLLVQQLPEYLEDQQDLLSLGCPVNLVVPVGQWALPVPEVRQVHFRDLHQFRQVLVVP
jgi:hypothetical protein